MFQDLVLLTACYAETTNGAASARKLLAARPPESRMEIEASATYSNRRVRTRTHGGVAGAGG